MGPGGSPWERLSTNRLRKSGDGVTLDVLYPVIRGTIDERLFRTVKQREKWLEFLLGAAPNFSEYSLTDEEPPPLPERLGPELAIDSGSSVRPGLIRLLLMYSGVHPRASTIEADFVDIELPGPRIRPRKPRAPAYSPPSRTISRRIRVRISEFMSRT